MLVLYVLRIQTNGKGRVSTILSFTALPHSAPLVPCIQSIHCSLWLNLWQPLHILLFPPFSLQAYQVLGLVQRLNFSYGRLSMEFCVFNILPCLFMAWEFISFCQLNNISLFAYTIHL